MQSLCQSWLEVLLCQTKNRFARNMLYDDHDEPMTILFLLEVDLSFDIDSVVRAPVSHNVAPVATV